VPAAAVIPAPRVYIKVVAVKKLVVGSKGGSVGSGPSGPGKDLSFPFYFFWDNTVGVFRQGGRRGFRKGLL
jgi:hypothetical protein